MTSCSCRNFSVLCAQNGTPEDRSPLYASQKIHGAVLLLHGDNDTNVLIAHSKLMQQKMLESTQDVTLFIAKGGGHGAGGNGWESHSQIVFDFLNKKL